VGTKILTPDGRVIPGVQGITWEIDVEGKHGAGIGIATVYIAIAAIDAQVDGANLKIVRDMG
jgi:hypothetical protein